jgi:DNA-binding MarR family transcriptional regulator
MNTNMPAPAPPAQEAARNTWGRDTLAKNTVQALLLALRAIVGLGARSSAVVDKDVTLPQFRALVVLAVRGSRRGTEIVDELQDNLSTGSRMLARLARKALVQRTRSGSDKRTMQARANIVDRRIVERVMTRRRADLQRIVEAASDLWRPEIVIALIGFAKAVGECEHQQWWRGWSEDHAGAAAVGRQQ